MSGDLIFNIALKSMSRSIHHKVAVEALGLIDDKWKRLFLKEVQIYLIGTKEPDKKFKDFMNHVYHVHQDWGGAPKSIKKWYDKLVEQIKEENWKEAVYTAGILSHYYIDLYHPFHTAQTPEEPHMHAYTEFGGAAIYQNKLRPLLKLGDVELVSDLVTSSKQSAKTSHNHYVDFLTKFEMNKAAGSKWGLAYSEELISITADLLSQATTGFASILHTAIEESKVNPPEVSLTVKSFIEALKIPIYWILRLMDNNEKKQITAAMEKEYEATGQVFNTLSEDDRTVTIEYDKAKKENKGWIDHPQLETQKTTVSEKQVKTTTKESTTKAVKKDKVVKYNLAHEDDIKDAPEIGQKTAERLKKIGINTVNDLLANTPETIAKKLGLSYIKAKDIERWQIESELMTVIADIRVHDVRIMYELGIRKKEDLAKKEAKSLLVEAINAAKKLGDRVVAESSMPTEKEMKEWIEKAKN